MLKQQQRHIMAYLLSLLASLSFGVLAQDNTLTPAEQDEGWQLLFNGTDMSQWRNFKSESIGKEWVVENGVMKLTGAGGGDILTKKQYKNFDFRAEWKISKAGNSGIFILADEIGNAIYSHAPEIQILDNERHSDNKIASHLSGSLYDLVASPVASHKPAGEWNQVRIVFTSGRIQTWQNGVASTDITVGSAEWNTVFANSKFSGVWYDFWSDWEGYAEAKQGHIGLQDHSDPVEFKNIKIKEL